MSTTHPSQTQLQDPKVQSAFRTVRLLVWSYVSLNLAAIAALIALKNNPEQATTEAWVHGVIVAATALLMLSFAIRAMRGSRTNHLRFRITSAIMLVAIAVIIAIPGGFPVWMKIQEGVGGLLLLGIAVIINRTTFKAAFEPNKS